MNKAYKKL